MSKGIIQAAHQVQAYALQVGCKSAPPEPTEQAGMFPFAVCYPALGTIQADDASSGRDLSQIWAEVHVSRNLVGRAILQAEQLLEAFGQVLKQNPRLNETVDTIVYPVRWSFGRLEWGGIQTIGFRFEIPIKVRNIL